MIRDPHGLYAELGVDPGSSAAEIKAAYRSKASKLHPDKNHGKDTTADFQRLQRAYDVLSDPERRADYDALAAEPQITEDDEGRPARFEPVRCTRCAAVSAQPRYRVFFSVFGYLVGATKTAHQGVFCARCESAVALQATAKTLALGWWSLHGLVWTVETLTRNLFGGKRFPEQDVMLQARQAMYFASAGRVDLARAVAEHAYQMSIKLAGANSKIAKVRERLGYKREDPLKDVRGVLRSFLDGFEGQAPAPELKDSAQVFNRRFATQSVLIGGFALVLGGWIVQEQRESARVEQARLEQAGIDRARAEAVARAEQDALKALEQPLPRSGVMGISKASAKWARDELPPFKVSAPPGANYVIKLVDLQSGTTGPRLFVRGGEVVEAGVPPGTYFVKTASGQTWYGDAVRFGPNTNYAQMEQTVTFGVEGDRLVGHELRLAQSRDGNLRKHGISADQF